MCSFILTIARYLHINYTAKGHHFAPNQPHSYSETHEGLERRSQGKLVIDSPHLRGRDNNTGLPFRTTFSVFLTKGSLAGRSTWLAPSQGSERSKAVSRCGGVPSGPALLEWQTTALWFIATYPKRCRASLATALHRVACTYSRIRAIRLFGRSF